jgi:dTDP-4-dehydrorhamnose 3,5-epimerase
MSIINYDPQTATVASEPFLTTPFAGVYYMPLQVFKDKRGYFTETGRMNEVEKITGQPFKIAQTNLSLSHKNVIRGFHAEGWNKLVTVTTGVALCAWADIRPDSATFGDILTMKLGDGEGANFGSVYLPHGIANSFLAVEGPMLYSYAVDKLYQDRDKSGDIAIALFDPDLGMKWPIDQDKMIVSQRDVESISLREKFPDKF